MWPNVSSTFTDRLFDTSASFAPVLSAQEGKVEVIEAMVKQALRTQSQWSDAVTDRIVSAPGLPSPIADAARQMHSVTENVLQFQTQLWDGWFRMLKGADPLGANPLSVPAVDIPRESPTAAPTEKAVVKAVEAALEAPPTLADDDLREISGVGPVLAEKLRAEGITSYQQVASWSDDDVARIEGTIIPARFAGRIARDGWIAQAKKLHQEKYGPSA